MGKSIVAAFDIPSGTLIEPRHIAVKSPGQGISPSKIKNVLGKRVQRSLVKDEFKFEEDFAKGEELNRKFSIKHPLWGIPVRPHDVIAMHNIFNSPVYEFHISYKDLDRSFPTEDWHILSDRKIVVHAPELFNDSRLLDLCSKMKRNNIANLNKVCEFARKLRQKIGTSQIIQIVTNIGGFHLMNSLEHEKSDLYKLVYENLNLINDEGCEITIQNMAPFPWHFGGQRYQNIFADPSEIVEFCKQMIGGLPWIQRIFLCIANSKTRFQCSDH